MLVESAIIIDILQHHLLYSCGGTMTTGIPLQDLFTYGYTAGRPGGQPQKLKITLVSLLQLSARRVFHFHNTPPSRAPSIAWAGISRRKKKITNPS